MNSVATRPQIQSLFVVEDDIRLLEAIRDALSPDVLNLRMCQDVTSARNLLSEEQPELLILDLCLPDGDAFDLLAEIHKQQPTPLVIAMSGAATPQHGFHLAKLGVHVFLQKPFDTGELHDAIRSAIHEPPDIRPQLKNIVGKRPIHDVEFEVRKTMVDEALSRTKGSRRGAARILDVSRQLIQHMLKQITR